MSYSVISLFSGAMGLDIGLEQSGMRVLVGQDFDHDCALTAHANNHLLIEDDIRNVSAESLLQAAGLNRSEAFLVCGGPPCQPFSTAGKRLGISDPRGSLFKDFVRIVHDVRPRFFLMENVKGITSAKLSEPVDGCQTVLDVILSEFAHLGYKTIHGLLDAVNYGAPQFRERFVVLGSRDHEPIFLPCPTHFQTHQCASMRWTTLRKAIEDIESNPGPGMAFSPERNRFLEMIPEGGNWRNLPAELQPEAMGGAYKSGGGKVGFYRRLSYDQPSPTVVTSPVQKSTMLCHPRATRPLSIKEYARIQGFPDSWIFAGNVSSQYRQIGNAVPVALGRAIGQMFVSVATNTHQVKTKRVRGTDVHKRVQLALTFDEERSHLPFGAFQ